MPVSGAILVPHPSIIIPNLGCGQEQEVQTTIDAYHAAARQAAAWEIVQNVVSACSRDPRFPSVGKAELDLLEYSVDVLGEPEAILSTDQLDVKRYL